MKKICGRLLMITMAMFWCFSLCACGGGGGLFGGGTSKNVFRVGIQENTEENAMMTDLIAGFKAANPDITMDFSIESYSGNYSDKLISQASSGALPDLFFTIDSLVGYFASTKITENVRPYFDTYRFSADLIYDEVIEVGKVGEEIHMLGREYSQVVLYYNKEIFDDAKQSYPTEDWTWDDMIAAGKAIAKQDADGTILRAGIDMRLNWPTTMLQYFEGHGGTLFNESGTEGKINAAARTAYTDLRAWTKEGTVLNTYANTGLGFMSGNVGMYFGVRADAPTVNKSLTSWDIVHVPDMDTHVVSLGASGYSVSALSAHKEIALRFLFFIMGTEGQTIMARRGNVVPALKSLATSDVWTNSPKEGLNYGAFLQEENVHKVYPISSYMHAPKNAGKLTDVLNDQVTSVILSSSGTIAETTWTDFEKKLTAAM